ncbi:tRNA-guanine transglycosylase [Micromonospora rifamycinica]|uniref:tRNA-guanine transglycosylase n=1 Tax=Micromonospora rifamycinica TaxID=291594 RepID=UPI00340D6685
MFSRELVINNGRKFELPIFLPVYQPHRMQALRSAWSEGPEIEGCIVNSYFLYKQRELRQQLVEGPGLHDYLGFDGLVTTDSGAFQGLTRQLYLNNADIVRFQDRIGSDIVSPLDLITPPGDKKAVAEAKLVSTEKRIVKAMGLVERGILVGVQQGGRYADLRKRSVEFLRDLGVRYLALGSLVPFFNRNHDLRFVGRTSAEAREIIGPDVPMHVYGAGDPVELPFLVACGVNVFDSASYGHYAQTGWYMTPYGALQDLDKLAAGEFVCACPVCQGAPPRTMPDTEQLIVHNLWTILVTIQTIRAHLATDTLPGYLDDVLKLHDEWFPTSALHSSWREIDLV